jgi:hypothetical protein
MENCVEPNFHFNVTSLNLHLNKKTMAKNRGVPIKGNNLPS